MKENKIPAVFKEDLRKFLIAIGESEAIQNGQRACSICSRTITLENIQIIIPRAEKKFEYICDDQECIETYNTPKIKP